MIMGLGGAIWAHRMTSIDPEAFNDLFGTFLIWTMVMVGGNGNNKGAVMGDVFGLEQALWFAKDSQDAFEKPTFKRSRSHSYVGLEVAAVRSKVGVSEIANFSKHEFKGTNARNFLNFLLAGTIPKPGRIALNPMLTEKGKLYGDLTVACLNEEKFMIFGSGAVQEMHRRWFEKYLPEIGVSYKNKSDEYHGLAISGPKSRELISKISREDFSNDAFKFRVPWYVTTPPGYSALYLDPFLHQNKYFRTWQGLMDTDMFNTTTDNGQIIMYPTVDKSFTIKKDTPVVQIIPYRREQWVASYGLKDPTNNFKEDSSKTSAYGKPSIAALCREEGDADSDDNQIPGGFYRKYMWTNKNKDFKDAPKEECPFDPKTGEMKKDFKEKQQDFNDKQRELTDLNWDGSESKKIDRD